MRIGHKFAAGFGLVAVVTLVVTGVENIGGGNRFVVR